nr:reverse transcriptase domain-containing protein [Tanacetum cinerariifolium]
MSTRSSARNPFPPLGNPELTIRRRSRSDPTLLNNSEMAAKGNGDLPVPDLRTMEELCQPSLSGWGGPIARIAIQAMNFRLKNDMSQQVQNSCQFHGLQGGTFMKRRLEECYDLIENMTAHHNDWDTSAQQKINKNLMSVLQVNQQVKAVTPNCETCGGPHSFFDCPATVGNTQNVYPAGAYQGPTIPATSSYLVVERKIEVTKDTMHPTNNGSTEDVQPSVVLTKSLILNSEPVTSPIIELVASPFGPSIKSLLTNKDKLCELARTPLNEHRLVVLLKKLPEKLGDPDFDVDPRVPLILERHFFKTGRAFIDVFEGELTLRVGKEAITFNLDQTSRYSTNYNDMTANRIDVIDMTCEEYLQQVIGFSDVIASGNPTPYYDLIVSTTSSTLTPFRNSDFLLEEVDAILALEDDPTLPEVDQSYVDFEGDILLLEAILTDGPSLPPLNQGNYLPEVRKELKICETKSDKSSIDEPPEVELKDLPRHLEYAFMEGDDKLPVLIAKDLSVEEKTALITVLKSHNTIVFLTVSLVISKFPSIRKIKRKPHSPSHTKRLLAAACLLGYAIYRARFREKMLKRCEDTNLCLKWEKSHFMVKEGIVLGHKISKEGIEVDKAKVDVITKLPHPTTVK